MDADLAHMMRFERYRDVVAYLLVPLLASRELISMPCKHARTFVWAEQRRRQYFEAIGEDYPGGDDALDEHPSYCDCTPFDRRAALIEIGEMCVKHGLHPHHLSDLASYLRAITTAAFTYNWAQRAIMDLICEPACNFDPSLGVIGAQF